MGIKGCRKKLLSFMLWIDAKITSHKDYSKHDPEWIATKNEAQGRLTCLRGRLSEQRTSTVGFIWSYLWSYTWRDDV